MGEVDLTDPIITVTEEIALRAIKTEDSAILLNLMHRIYKPVYERLWLDDGSWYVNETYSKANIERELDDERSHYYFVLRESDIIGILRVVPGEGIPGFEGSDVVKLHRIYLDPQIIGKGIGQTLITWVEEKFCRQPNSVMWLEVMDTEVRAIKFYEKLGFETVGKKTLGFAMMRSELRGMYTMIKRY